MHTATIHYSQINNYIYLGTNNCCQLNFDKKLLDKGIRANISLEDERLDQPRGVDYYLWLPVIDDQSPSQEQLAVGTAFITELVANKIKVFVHCKLGHGRSPTLVIAYLISQGMTLKAAHDYVKARRPEVHLTKAQEVGLKKFAKMHHRK
ncbi:MAG: Dual specificity protein phosphatase [Candidatus Falkowbacteria bacterium GW2011_GWA2_39_24]|uniref:Dual specificity protein phosphatase n=1 Tax=Candidatus Falkowbacteria bacterium GW2011_GWA2_39_24 TaxID=1618634 RepID=A0A0G0RM54_9BACT|nr:MAG: Dual specificity protein phosphatase [Candidatus Falkowbacteria bacterium GW2011_GWA2_39_24]